MNRVVVLALTAMFVLTAATRALAATAGNVEVVNEPARPVYVVNFDSNSPLVTIGLLVVIALLLGLIWLALGGLRGSIDKLTEKLPKS